MHIAQVLDNKKATRVKVLRVHDLTVLADYFVIASGTSTTQVASLAAPLTGRAFLRPAAPDGRGSENGRRCPQAPAGPGAWLYIRAEMC